MWRFLPFTRISPRAKKPYINQPGFPNLYVLPYVRGRLVFAELLARAVEEEEFDLLVMDLPHFMNDARFLEFPLKFFPLVSSLIIRRDKDHFSLFPFVPNDAGCLAAYMARKKFDGFYECVDENLMSYPEGYLFQPEMSVRDDYFVFSQGLKEYFSPLWDHLDNLWREVTYFQKNYTRFRVSRVTGRLRNCLAQGGKVLFVCEYQLWWGIKKWLEEGMEEAGSATPALKEEVWDGACILEDPYLLWIKGLLDDYPAINNLFFQMLQEGRAESFDKLNVLNEIMACMASPAKSKESGNASIRSLLNFSSYLRARVVSHGRIIIAFFIRDDDPRF